MVANAHERSIATRSGRDRSSWNQELADRVRFAMEGLGLTATELSLRCGLSHVYVTHLLSGRISGPRIDVAAKLCDGIGCKLDWLLGGRGEPPNLSKVTRERCVYFVRRGSDGAIKIGTTLSLQTRIMNLRAGNGDKLELLASFPGGFAEETALHRRFRSSRVRGEWFAPTDELLALIQQKAL